MKPMIKMKRAYEPAERGDGYRVLIDRLWPRGIKKADLVLDEWAKELAPSSELRKRFGHDPNKWREFRTQYQMELRASEARAKIDELVKRAHRSNVTLIYSARDEEHNDAVVLRDVLERAEKRTTNEGRASRKAA
jgi:uncharacterized protein YeaO (DUF488 family)